MSPPVLTGPDAVAPRLSRTTWLRLAGSLALVEVILVLAGVIPAWLAIVIAVLALVSYVSLRRRITSTTGRSALWAAALSQAVVLVVPAVLTIVGWILVAGIVVAGAVVLLLLLRDNR